MLVVSSTANINHFPQPTLFPSCCESPAASSYLSFLHHLSRHLLMIGNSVRSTSSFTLPARAMRTISTSKAIPFQTHLASCRRVNNLRMAARWQRLTKLLTGSLSRDHLPTIRRGSTLVPSGISLPGKMSLSARFTKCFDLMRPATIGFCGTGSSRPSSPSRLRRCRKAECASTSSSTSF